MAAEIASASWVAQLDRAVAEVDAGPVEATVLHRIDGDGAWLITLSGGRARATVADPAAAADLTFTWQRADAEAVARGDHSPLVAFGAGRLRVGGDLTRLVEVAEVLARFPAVGGA